VKDIRARRLAELIKQEVAFIIDREVKDPRVKDVVLTYVRLNGDLSEALIFFDSYNKDKLRAIQSGLSATAGFIRHTLKSRVSLKRVPSITFLKDDTTDFAIRTDRLIEQVRAQDLLASQRAGNQSEED
jgi:ribosome-binding factor A